MYLWLKTYVKILYIAKSKLPKKNQDKCTFFEFLVKIFLFQ